MKKTVKNKIYAVLVFTLVSLCVVVLPSSALEYNVVRVSTPFISIGINSGFTVSKNPCFYSSRTCYNTPFVVREYIQRPYCANVYYDTRFVNLYSFHKNPVIKQGDFSKRHHHKRH